MSFEVRRTGRFDAWFDGLTDEIAKKAVHDRIIRVEGGLLGDRKSVGDRVSEFKVDIGPGYRLYYTMQGQGIVLLLYGGSKKTQRSDIKKAEALAKAMNRQKEPPAAGRVRERRAGYAPKRVEDDELSFTETDLEVRRFDSADYIRGDDDTQIYLLRQALPSGHAGYIASAIGAVARARGLTSLNEKPTLETLTTVLNALGLRLEVVENKPAA